MTISEDWFKYKCKTRRASIPTLFGVDFIDVEIKVGWVSCGYYTFEWPPFEIPHRFNPEAMDKIPYMHMSITPEDFRKTIELYDNPQEEITRDKLLAPYYEKLNFDAGMFDFGHDGLFRAYKHVNGWVILHDHLIVCGCPTKEITEWIVHIDDLRKIQEELKSHDIFYTGVKFASPPNCFSGFKND